MRRLAIFIILLCIMVFVAFAAMFFLIYSTAAQDTKSFADAIVVLGAAQYDGTPSPVFQSRLDHAHSLYAQKRAPLIIVSGGKLPKDSYSEAISGKKYLLEKGIPDSAILIDENSFSTKHNLARVKDIADEKGIITIIIISDPFHIYRSLIIAKDLGLTAEASPTRSSPINNNPRLEFSFVVREVFLTYAHVIFDL